MKLYKGDSHLFSHANIKTVRINYLYVKFKEHESVVWGNNKNHEKMRLLSSIWLLDKYKYYPEIIMSLKRFLNSTVNNLKYSNPLELYNDLVNEVSEEALNKFTGEEKMKKMLIGGLVVLLMTGLFVGCPEDGKQNEEDKDKNSYNGLSVDEKFWGDWGSEGNTYISFKVTKTQIIGYNNQYGQVETSRDPAWSVGNDLMYVRRFSDGTYDIEEKKYATLRDGKLFLNDGTPKIKK